MFQIFSIQLRQQGIYESSSFFADTGYQSGIIRRGIQSGEFRDIDPALAVKGMVAPMLLAAIWKTVFEPLGAEPLDIEAYAAQHIETFLRGIAT